jgi:nucleoside-diphosphate-sugar epimerase
VRRLEAAGIEVVAPRRDAGGDILRDELPLAGIDHVFHLAGRTGVPDAWADPAGFFLTNAAGTVRLLDQCRRHGASLTYVSAYVYGRPLRLPTAETDPVAADNPYAFSKSVAEQACRFFAAHFAVPATILRPFNIYGPGQSRRFLVPHIAAQVADPDCAEILVADLAPRRDYVFVSDAVDAILASLAAPAGSLFNIGSGASHSVEEVIRTACEAAGVQKPYRATSAERRINELDDVVADVSALRRTTGWSPLVPLAAGLKQVIEDLRRT